MLALVAEATIRTVRVNPSGLEYAAGTLVPIAVAILAKSTASPALKAILNAVLATLTGLLIASTKLDGNIDLYGWADAVGRTLVTSWAAYYGFLKPTKITGSIASATAGFGLGKAA